MSVELARRVAIVARALTWERALRSAREQGEPADPRFAHAPYDELTTLLHLAAPRGLTRWCV
jgi:hypothetical protein